MSQQELRADTFYIITSTGPAIGLQLLLTNSLPTNTFFYSGHDFRPTI